MMHQDLYRIQFDLSVLAGMLAECHEMHGQSIKLIRAMDLLTKIQSTIGEMYAVEIADDPK